MDEAAATTPGDSPYTSGPYLLVALPESVASFAPQNLSGFFTAIAGAWR